MAATIAVRFWTVQGVSIVMKTAEECLKLARQNQDQANKSGVSPRMASVLRSISGSFVGLASQYNLLKEIADDERRGPMR